MKNTPEKHILSRYEFTQEFKDQVVYEVLYEGKDKRKTAEKYELPSLQTLTNWIRHYKQRLKRGAITLPPMTKQQKENLRGLRKRIKEMEKALEEAQVLIFGLNTMIDLAEEEYGIPIRKKSGTKR